ncbi:hypothetical protein NQ314_002864 [Rhamnusium bicolor]|uniref:CCHC-type domain-containing protein n=1 Tax=Rhamnusium bicolor TaxID=1586634 RepID=A0AAV8ZPK3_9CUCU|nr:hypothetical protein NQ314_002864 [Rhamnusium bicolor]
MSNFKNALPQVGRKYFPESHTTQVVCPTDSGGGKKATTERSEGINVADGLLEKGSQISDPFKRRSILERTPPLVRSASYDFLPQDDENLVNTTTKAAPSAHNSQDDVVFDDRNTQRDAEKQEMRSDQSALKNLWERSDELDREEDEQVQKLKNILKKMEDFCKLHKNMHRSIKDGLEEARDAADHLTFTRDSRKRALQKFNKTATKELTKITAVKERTIQAAAKPKRSAKDETRRAKNANFESSARKRTREPTASPADKASALRMDKKKKKGEDDPDGWILAQNKRHKRRENATAAGEVKTPKMGNTTPGQRNQKRTRNRTRLEAVLIKPLAGKKYADVLKEIRGKVRPEEMNVDIKSIRETRAGDVLLELGRKTADKEKFSSALKEAVGQIGNVRNLVPRGTVEIRDLDGVTDEDDIRNAVERNIKETAGPVKVRMSKTYRGQKTAIVEMNELGVSELLKRSRIKIGWVNCRVRQWLLISRCYRCLGYGHQSTGCKGPDGSKLCYKCGKEDHRAAACGERPRCVLCTERKDKEPVDHIAGSGSCRVFREELGKVKRPRNATATAR